MGEITGRLHKIHVEPCLWTCPACGREQQGYVTQGCVACGAGDPAKATTTEAPTFDGNGYPGRDALLQRLEGQAVQAGAQTIDQMIAQAEQLVATLKQAKSLQEADAAEEPEETDDHQ